MNVLVTGGAGYLGAVLVRQLLDRCHSVTVLDRFFFGREPLAGLDCKLISGDVRAWQDEWLDGIDAVAHLAGLSNDPTAEYRPDANHEMNVVATESLVKACVRRGIQRFTFASSASIYDREDGKPGEIYDESSPVQPRGAYSKSKYEAERIIMQHVSDAFFPTILRQGTVYGDSPRMRFDLVVNAFVKDAIARGKLTVHNMGKMYRPLVSVKYAANAHIAALTDNTPLRCGIFNVVEENVKIRDLAALVTGLCQCAFPFTSQIDLSPEGPRIVRNYQISGKKLRSNIGWIAGKSIGASVEEMLGKWTDFSAQGLEKLVDPRHYNIRWMTLLEQMHREQGRFESIY